MTARVPLLTSVRRRVFAAVYDQLTAGAERGLAPLRERTAGRARGRVLEIGAGTGANLPYYTDDVSLTVCEPNPSMVTRLQRKAATRRRSVEVDVVDAGRLPYPGARFDTVVATLVLCSVADPASVLAEVRRVLRPGGEFLFLEHVAARSPRVRQWQRRLNPVQRFFADGCELDRDTASTIRAAGFTATEIQEMDVRHLPELIRHIIFGVALV